ncbi:MAG: fliE [Xanthobacteraceae bacterium]|nr:fliE [Xanthobacteraceae bacterium]
MSSPIAAARAYANLARITDPNAGAGGALGGAIGGLTGTKPSGPDFSSVLKEAMGSVVDAGRKSDAQSQALAGGKANLIDVATAVAETEVAIETMVSVRDKVIQAYEEIMRMQI